ncbi:MAG: S1 RNA-binding domain-containing protein [Anaerolineales bacterium]|nr:S1 RNA-binding domain-containing protein [Anaerolineales bacterium]
MATTNETAQASALEPKTKVTGKVVKTTLAGALIDLGMDLPGVIHISQLQKEAVNKVEDIVKIGDSVETWVRRVKKDSVELTMIEPLELEWREIKPQMVVKGKVVRLENYGAFIEIGAERPGLVHISEMAHGYIKSPGDVLKEGDEIDIMVLEVNRRKKQIRLSLKAALPEEESAAPVKQESKGQRKRNVKPSLEDVPAAGPSEPELTAMEIAWQEALERAKEKEKGPKAKRSKAATTKEQEDLLNRTLEKRLPTGG